MISFSHNSKIEVLESSHENDCCALAFIYAVVRTSGKINKKNRNSIEITTDVLELSHYINGIIKKLYGEEVKLEEEKNFRVNRAVYYKIIISPEVSQNLLLDCGYLTLEDGQAIKHDEINRYMIQEECCKVSYIKGIFIGSATSSIKISEKAEDKTSSGYHLEFTSKNKNVLTELLEMLSEYNISSKIIKRKNVFVLYFKEANQVSDVLALVGAYNSVLILQNEMAKRELRNKVNRQTNCVSANISKTVEACIKQLEAIEYIDNKVGISSLPYDLEEVAILRIANTEESLEELIKLSNIKLTKSGLNHRFRKIINFAEELKKKEKN